MTLMQLKMLRDHFVKNYDIAHKWADTMVWDGQPCLIKTMCNMGYHGDVLVQEIANIWPGVSIVPELRHNKDFVLNMLERKIAMYEEYELNQKEEKWDSQPEGRNTEKSNVTVVNPEAHYNHLELIETN